MKQIESGSRGLYGTMAAALLLAMTLTAITRPTPAADEVVRKVKISDLNLALPQDQKTLARRLRFAVDQVCGARYTTNLVYATRREALACREKAWGEVRQQLEAHGLPSMLAASR